MATASAVRVQQQPDAKPGVLVFTRGLLPRSETFIQDHVQSLRRYRPTLVGLGPVARGLNVEGCDLRLISPQGSRMARPRLALSPWSGPLDRIARAMSPTLIHAHFVINALALLPFLSRRKLPLLVTAHGFDVAADPASMPLADRLLYRLRMPALIRRVDRVLCVSETVRTFAIERGFAPDRCVVQHLGVRPRAPQPGRPVPGRVLFVGRLVEKKGLRELLHAAARVRQQGLTLDLRVIGEGPERQSLEALSRSIGAGATFLGPQSRATVARELSTAWLFCMPCRRAANGDSDGLPIVFLEAQAAGVPVLAFDNGPAREAIAAGITGLLVPDGDIGALADALARLLRDPDLRNRLASTGPAYVAQHFDLARNTAQLEDIYDDVVERGAGSASERAGYSS